VLEALRDAMVKVQVEKSGMTECDAWELIVEDQVAGETPWVRADALITKLWPGSTEHAQVLEAFRQLYQWADEGVLLMRSQEPILVTFSAPCQVQFPRCLGVECM
jgi:hypothetical protein